ncbi:MAG: RDD family protein [Minicystis sp.]
MAQLSDSDGGDYNPYAPPSATHDVAPASSEDDVVLPAERGTRWWARVVDGVLFVGSYLVSLVMVIVVPFESSSTTRLVLLGLIPLAFLCYQAFLISTTGQSIAKRWLKIKVVRMDGSLPGFVSGVLLREIVLLGLAPIPVIGFLVRLVDSIMIFGNERRCLHDYLAGTKVVLVLRA